MDLFHNLIFGFGVALSWQNLIYCLIGVSVGTLIGVLPGIGPLGTIAILLPITFNDGYQMARQGRAGPALAIAAIGSFFAGTVGTLLIALFGPPLADSALKFGAPEYFSLMLMGLVAAAVLAQGDMVKSLAMVLMGLLLGIVGNDVNTGIGRFTFGVTHLFPTKEDMKRSIGPIVRGTALGAFFGVLPGTGPAVASLSSYLVEKK